MKCVVGNVFHFIPYNNSNNNKKQGKQHKKNVQFKWWFEVCLLQCKRHKISSYDMELVQSFRDIYLVFIYVCQNNIYIVYVHRATVHRQHWKYSQQTNNSLACRFCSFFFFFFFLILILFFHFYFLSFEKRAWFMCYEPVQHEHQHSFEREVSRTRSIHIFHPFIAIHFIDDCVFAVISILS